MAQAEVAQAWTSAIGWAQARQSPRYLRRNLVKGTALAGMPPCSRLLNDDREDRGMVTQGLVFAVEVVTPAMPGHTEARCGNIEDFSKGTRLQRVLTNTPSIVIDEMALWSRA